MKKIKVGLEGVHRASPSQLDLLEGDACQRIATATERKLRTEGTCLNGDRTQRMQIILALSRFKDSKYAPAGTPSGQT